MHLYCAAVLQFLPAYSYSWRTANNLPCTPWECCDEKDFASLLKEEKQHGMCP